jgi:hypothetical protein
MDEFRFGSAFGSIVKIGLKQFPAFVAVVAIFVVPLFLLEKFGAPLLEQWLEIAATGNPILSVRGAMGTGKFWLAVLVFVGLLFTLSCLAETLTGLLVIARLRQRPATLRAAFQQLPGVIGRVMAAVARLWGMVAAMALPGVVIACVSAGLVPGVYFVVPWLGIWVGVGVALLGYFVIITMYAPLVPVVLTETLSSAEAMERAADLTDGTRWQIFWLLVVFSAIAGFSVGFLGSLTGSLYEPARIYAENTLDLLTRPFLAILASVVWHGLKRNREGGETTSVADVFA